MLGRWLTFAELAAEMGVSANAARSRAIRRRWRRQTGNDGMARVLVPEGEAISPMRTRRVQPAVPHADAPTDGHAHAIDPELLQRLDKAQAELTAMAQRLGASEAETMNARRTAQELRVLLEETRVDRDTWKAQADAWRAQSEMAQQQQVQTAQQQDELRADRDAWRTQAETAQQQVQEMLQRLTERRPGLFARLFRKAG